MPVASPVAMMERGFSVLLDMGGFRGTLRKENGRDKWVMRRYLLYR